MEFVGFEWPDEVEHLADGLAITGGTYSSGESARVVGCVVTRLPDVASAGPSVAAALRRRNLTLLAAVPFSIALTQPRVRDVVRALRPRVLSAGDQSRRIRDVSVLAQNIPGGLRVITDGRLIVVPGDRHDVIMAACLATLNGVRLAALLLTVGIEPDPAVWALTGAATETGLPILVTSEATYPTVMAVEAIDVDLASDDLQRAGAVMAHGAAAFDDDAIAGLLSAPEQRRLSPAAFRFRLTERARQVSSRIVLPEGTEPRTVRAAAEVVERGIAIPVWSAPGLP